MKDNIKHWSDCALHNEPAYPAGECNCGGYFPPLKFNQEFIKKIKNGQKISSLRKEPKQLGIYQICDQYGKEIGTKIEIDLVCKVILQTNLITTYIEPDKSYVSFKDEGFEKRSEFLDCIKEIYGEMPEILYLHKFRVLENK